MAISYSVSEKQIQIRLTTKQSIYAVSEFPLSVPTTISSESLNQLVNQLLKEANLECVKNIHFDFLVTGEVLRLPLIEHLKKRNISTESVVEVEYIERVPAPEPYDTLLHDDWISTVDSNNSWILTGCYDHSVNVWSTHGKLITQLNNHNNIVKGVKWINGNDPSKGFISVSHDLKGVLWSWNVETNTAKPVAYLKGHERPIDCVSVSPNTERIATGGWDKTLKIWSTSLETESEHVRKKFKSSSGDTVTKIPLHTLNGHKETISSVGWVDDHVVCTSSMDHTIKFWDVELYGVKNEIIGQKAFLSLSWSPLSNTLITSSADRHIRLYDPRSTEGAVCKKTFSSHKLWVSSVAWSKYHEHLFLSAGYDGVVKVWDTRSTDAPLYDLQGHEGQVLCVDFSSNKYIMSGGTDNRLHIFSNKDV